MAEGSSRGVSSRTIGLGLGVALLAWFILANLDDVNITFFLWDADVALALGLLIAAALGIAVGYFVGRASAKR